MAPPALADVDPLGDGGGGGNDGGDSGDGTDDGQSDDDGRSRVEWLVMAASVVVTVVLFAFVAWNAVAGVDSATPAVTVERIGTTDDGRTHHEVRLSNPGDRGFERVTVVVACGDPPRELAFEHVPPQGQREATVLCPSGESDPPSSVVSWASP